MDPVCTLVPKSLGRAATAARLRKRASAVSKPEYLGYHRSDFGPTGATSVQPERLRFNRSDFGSTGATSVQPELLRF